MSRYKSPLDNIKIASPCSANWSQMYGNDRMRFCGDCKLNVYNLSGMTRNEAENLIMNAEGRLCVRFSASRRDGDHRELPGGLGKSEGEGKDIRHRGVFAVDDVYRRRVFCFAVYAANRRTGSGQNLRSADPDIKYCDNGCRRGQHKPGHDGR